MNGRTSAEQPAPAVWSVVAAALGVDVMPQTLGFIDRLIGTHGPDYTWALLRALDTKTEDEASLRARADQALAVLARGAGAGDSPQRRQAVVFEHAAALSAAIAEDLLQSPPPRRGGVIASCP